MFKLLPLVIIFSLIACKKTETAAAACAGKTGTYRVSEITCNGAVVSSAITRTIAIDDNCGGSWANSLSNFCVTSFVSVFTFSGTTLTIDRGERRCEACTTECTATADVDILSTHSYTLSGTVLAMTRTITQTDVDSGLAICSLGQVEVVTATGM